MMANVPDKSDGPLTQRGSGQSDVYAYAHIRTGTYPCSVVWASPCAPGHHLHGPEGEVCGGGAGGPSTATYA